MKTFEIEYEIPPLRAIYGAECDAETKPELIDLIKKEKPHWRIRKITKKKAK